MDRATRATAGQVFEAIWTTLVGVVGTPMTATLLRRAVRQAAAGLDGQALAGFEIQRAELEFRYQLPASWHHRDEAALRALEHVVRAGMMPLLRELTGDVVVRLLARSPLIATSGVLGEEGRSDR